MVDPVTLGTLALGALVGGGTAAAAGAFGGGSGEPAPTVQTPTATTPATNPIGSKPAKRSAQPSFLAGASMLPQAGGSPGAMGAGPSGGKTLLGQ